MAQRPDESKPDQRNMIPKRVSTTFVYPKARFLSSWSTFWEHVCGKQQGQTFFWPVESGCEKASFQVLKIYRPQVLSPNRRRDLASLPQPRSWFLVLLGRELAKVTHGMMGEMGIRDWTPLARTPESAGEGDTLARALGGCLNAGKAPHGKGGRGQSNERSTWTLKYSRNWRLP